MREVVGGDATPSVADSYCYSRRAVLEGEDVRVGWRRCRRVVACEALRDLVYVSLVLIFNLLIANVFYVLASPILRYEFRKWGNGHFDGFALHATLYCRAERVLEQFSDDVFEVNRYMRKFVVGFAVDDNGRSDAVFQLADFAHHVCAMIYNPRRPEPSIDNTNISWVLVYVVHHIAMRLTGEMQREVLL